MTDLQATASGLPTSPVPPRLDVGGTTRATWRVFRQQPWPFIGLLFIPIVAALPVQILSAIIKAATRAAAGRVSTAAITITILMSLLAMVVQYGAQFTCQLAGIWGAARNMEGNRFTIGDALRAGFGRLLAYVGLVLLMFLIVIIGFLLLIVPGIIAAGFLAVAPAACVIERRGPIGSIKRSISLITDNWWRSLGTGLLTIFLPVLAFSAVVFVVYLICAALGIKALTFIMILPAIPFFIVLGAVATILPAVLFVELCALKEGRTHGGVAGVFE